MKAAVWPVLAKPGLETVGVTEWLIEHQREALVVPVQVVAMAVTYVIAWFAIRRGRPALPWMAIALLAFSLTTLYPVHYLYYDVLLLLASAAVASAWPGAGALRTSGMWISSMIAAGIIVVVCLRASVSARPDLSVGAPAAAQMLQTGFSDVEHDGPRGFAWATGHESRLAIARGSSGDADLVLAAESALGPKSPLQHVTGILNGVVVADTDMSAGPTQLHISVPRGAWWSGFNDLHLVFSSAESPYDTGTGDDRRPLAMALSRVSVVPKKP
jgi:hypothetical protein